MMIIEWPLLNVEGKKKKGKYFLIKSDTNRLYFIIPIFFVHYDQSHKQSLKHVGFLQKY